MKNGLPLSIRGFESVEDHAALLVESYQRYTGVSLLPAESQTDENSLAARLHAAPLVVLAHGTEEDPIIHYGNLAALALWEREWEDFTTMPSRFTAEPMLREERDRFLQRVAACGYVDDFSGVRVSSTGRRYQIEGGVVWNLVDEQGAYRGQAAAFRNYRAIEA